MIINRKLSNKLPISVFFNILKPKSLKAITSGGTPVAITIKKYSQNKFRIVFFLQSIPNLSNIFNPG
jgi:hypothetical protein